METCTICGRAPHACVVSSREAQDRESPLARWAADSAITNSELGARVALRSILELLERHGYDDAHEIVKSFGEVAIAAGFARDAWQNDSQPIGDATATTNNGEANDLGK